MNVKLRMKITTVPAAAEEVGIVHSLEAEGLSLAETRSEMQPVTIPVSDAAASVAAAS